MKTINKVAIFGSARIQENETEYNVAYKLAKEFAQNGVDIVTGGGPGIMEAANKGAIDANGRSYGYTLDIKDQVPNFYCSRELLYKCKDFQERKKLLMQDIDVFIVFPGGFGTLDEFFEVLVHILTNKIKLAPIILYHKVFWNELISWFQLKLANQGMVEQRYVEILMISDTLEEIIQNIEIFFGNRFKKICQ